MWNSTPTGALLFYHNSYNMLFNKNLKNKPTGNVGKNVQFIKELQERHGDFDNVKSLMNRSINQLINDFIVEKNAKNEAYYFILEKGYLEQFKEYSKVNT